MSLVPIPQFAGAQIRPRQHIRGGCEAGDPESEFNLLALEKYPVLELTGGLLVVDERFLWRRCTTGLFHIVDEALRHRDPKEAQNFRIAYGAMVEALVLDSIRPTAPPALGAGTNYYTEDDIEAAYGTVPRCDAVVDFGDTLLLVEVVSGQLSLPTRIGGDVTQFESDFERLIGDKCRQLDSAARLLIDNEEPLTGVMAGVRHPRILPVLVVGGGFPINPLSADHVTEQLVDMNYLQHPLVDHLAVLDPADVEQLEGLCEVEGLSPIQVLRAWTQSDIAGVPLRNFLFRTYGSGPHRPARMKEVVDAVFEDGIRRLNFKRKDPTESTVPVD